MTKNVLLVGCSNLINKQDIWNEVVFDGQANITNLSFDGVGNYFISGNLIDYLEDNKTDYVFLQFSGLSRYDLPVHEEYSHFEDYYLPKTYKRKWLCSGGNTGQWLGKNKITEFFMPLYFNSTNIDHLISQSFCAVFGALSYLDQNKISYNWTFYYDILNPATNFVEEHDGKAKKFPKFLNMKNWIDNDPHTYCAGKNGLLEDKMHFHDQYYKEWLTKNKNKLSYEAD